MLNQVVSVGRLTRDVEVHETEDGKKVATLNLAIPRSFKNSEGVYDTDFIDFVVFDNIAENTSEYVKKGDIVGVKGRVQSRVIEKEDGEKEYVKDIIAEKVTFLSSNKEKTEEQVHDNEDEMEM